VSGDDSGDPTRKYPDGLLEKAKALSEPVKQPLAPPVWDEPDDEVPTEVLGPPLPLIARPSPSKPAPQARELDLAFRPLVVHPQPPAEGDAPYADTALRPSVQPAEQTAAFAFDPDDDEKDDPTIVIPVLTAATAQAVVPAGLPRKASAPALAAVKPTGGKQRG
jgi:hypothetical protein